MFYFLSAFDKVCLWMANEDIKKHGPLAAAVILHSEVARGASSYFLSAEHHREGAEGG